MVNQAVILAGGRGDRLRPITDNIPKPMAPVNGKPFLDYLIQTVINVGIDNILILTGYKADIIENRYSNIKGVNINFHRGKVSDKTGSRLFNAFNLLDNYFLLLYGDNYWPIELNAMWSNYQQLGIKVSTTVFLNKNGKGEYGFENNVVIGNNGIVVKYDKKRENSEANGVDIGYFIVSKASLDSGLSGNLSFEIDILPQFIAKKQVGAFVTNNQYYYITNMQTLKDFENATLLNNFLPIPQEYFGV